MRRPSGSHLSAASERDRRVSRRGRRGCNGRRVRAVDEFGGWSTGSRRRAGRGRWPAWSGHRRVACLAELMWRRLQPVAPAPPNVGTERGHRIASAAPDRHGGTYQFEARADVAAAVVATALSGGDVPRRRVSADSSARDREREERHFGRASGGSVSAIKGRENHIAATPAEWERNGITSMMPLVSRSGGLSPRPIGRSRRRLSPVIPTRQLTERGGTITGSRGRWSSSVRSGSGVVGLDVSEHAEAVPGWEGLDEPGRAVESDA